MSYCYVSYMVAVFFFLEGGWCGLLDCYGFIVFVCEALGKDVVRVGEGGDVRRGKVREECGV